MNKYLELLVIASNIIFNENRRNEICLTFS